MNKMSNKEFRRAFVESNVRRGLAYQVRAMRKAKKMSQGELGGLLAKPQNVVSRLENPSYGKWTVQTLLEVAAGFDVAVLVKFVPYSRLVRETEDLSNEALAPMDYQTELKSQSSHRPYREDGVIVVGETAPDDGFDSMNRLTLSPDIALHPQQTGEGP
jgi:hypothetical protein